MTASVSSGDLVSDASPPLAWLRDLLGPPPPGSGRASSGGPATPARALAWYAFPRFRAQHSSPPRRSERAAHPSSVQRRHVAVRSDPEAGCRGPRSGSGAGSALSRERFVVRTGPAVDPAMDLVGSVLPRVLGVPRVEVAVSIGRQLRPNLKPVLQIMAPEGDVLAYAKLGWNPLTRSLVENEAAVLRAWSHARPKHILGSGAHPRGDLERDVDDGDVPGPESVLGAFWSCAERRRDHGGCGARGHRTFCACHEFLPDRGSTNGFRRCPQ